MGAKRAWTVALAALVAAAGLGLPHADGAPTPVDGTPLCGTAAPAGSTVYGSRSDKLKVGSFNLLHSDTDEGDATLGARFPLEARALVDADVDVIGVQEATRNEAYDAAHEAPQKHGFVAQRLAAELARLTRQRWEYCWSQSGPHVPLTPDVEPG